MDKIITSAIITDGTSDRALIPLLQLLLNEHLKLPFEEPQFVHSTSNILSEKIADAIQKFEVDILFIHRDAENENWEKRKKEIVDAIPAGLTISVIPVIPIKMTEAWLLTDPVAIRMAVGNQHSNQKITLPKITQIENCDAKQVLLTALTEAKELSTQRRRKFRPEQFRHRVAELTSNLQLIRQIPSFHRLEQCLAPILLKLNSSPPC